MAGMRQAGMRQHASSGRGQARTAMPKGSPALPCRGAGLLARLPLRARALRCACSAEPNSA